MTLAAQRKPDADAAAVNMPARDMQHISEIIWESLRAHRPPNNRTRFRVAAHVPKRDGNNDVQARQTDEDLQAIINEFNALPEHEQSSILGGWSPESLRYDRAEFENSRLAMAPVLLLHADKDSSIMEDPIAQFAAVYDDGPHLLQLAILAGTTKAECLRALDCLTHQLDRNWDRLIMDPLKERQYGK